MGVGREKKKTYIFFLGVVCFRLQLTYCIMDEANRLHYSTVETMLFETLEDILHVFMWKGFNDKIQELRGILDDKFSCLNLRLFQCWAVHESNSESDETDTIDSPSVTVVSSSYEEMTAPSPRASTSNVRDNMRQEDDVVSTPQGRSANGDSNVGNCPLCLESMLEKDRDVFLMLKLMARANHSADGDTPKWTVCL